MKELEVLHAELDRMRDYGTREAQRASAMRMALMRAQKQITEARSDLALLRAATINDMDTVDAIIAFGEANPEMPLAAFLEAVRKGAYLTPLDERFDAIMDSKP